MEIEPSLSTQRGDIPAGSGQWELPQSEDSFQKSLDIGRVEAPPLGTGQSVGWGGKGWEEVGAFSKGSSTDPC